MDAGVVMSWRIYLASCYSLFLSSVPRLWKLETAAMFKRHISFCLQVDTPSIRLPETEKSVAQTSTQSWQ
eukprot:scaffold167015_cov27-Prasinocladus_malaysianus.AAC.1